MARGYVATQSYHLKSSPTKVFRALTEPDELVRWFLSGARLQPAPGAPFVFEWIGGYRMESHLTGFSPGKSVGFAWIDSLPGGKLARTTVEFRVRPKGRGTILSLRHSGFTVPEHFAECSSRWAYYLTNLKSVLDHGTDLRSKFDW